MVWTGCRIARARAGRGSFAPSVVVSVKALACQMPHDTGLPHSRFHVPDIQREILRRRLVASIGKTTIWRWLSEDALRPWRYRSWIFPRAPNFAEKAGRVGNTVYSQAPDDPYRSIDLRDLYGTLLKKWLGNPDPLSILPVDHQDPNTYWTAPNFDLGFLA